MKFKGVEICCPQCRGELAEEGSGGSHLCCQSCGREYPVLFGIPDLRVFSDPYLEIEQDRQKGLALAESFDRKSFLELVAAYYQGKKDIPAGLIQQYVHGITNGTARAQATLESWERSAARLNPAPAGRLLEVGCGTGPLLSAAASQYELAAGVDIGLRWLVLAKKRLAEAGLDFPLICACAEALPFPDQSFDRVVSESTLENVRDQRTSLLEAQRVLVKEGCLCLSTPNRYSLGPDPQVGIWAGGYLPEGWIAALVRRKGGIPPKRRLLSANSLQSLARAAGFLRCEIYLPDIPDAQRKFLGKGLNSLISAYHRLKRLPITSSVLRYIGPMLHLVAIK